MFKKRDKRRRRKEKVFFFSKESCLSLWILMSTKAFAYGEELTVFLNYSWEGKKVCFLEKCREIDKRKRNRQWNFLNFLFTSRFCLRNFPSHSTWLIGSRWTDFNFLLFIFSPKRNESSLRKFVATDFVQLFC